MANFYFATENSPPKLQFLVVNVVQYRGFKVEVPRFDGTFVEDWLFKVEEYFALYFVEEDQKIRLASIHLDGPAFAWYKWLMTNCRVSTWHELTKAALLRFGTTLYEDHRGALKDVRQITSVESYQAEFEAISTKSSGLPEQWQVSFFIAGLKKHLRCAVLLARPSNYYEAVSLAKLHEQMHEEMQLAMKGPFLKNNSHYSGKTLTATASTSGTAMSKTAPMLEWKNQSGGSVVNPVTMAGTGAVGIKNGTVPTYKRLSVAELRAKREKGLCYYWDDKYVGNCRRLTQRKQK